MGNNRSKCHTGNKDMEHIPRPLFKSFSHVGRQWCKKSLPDHLAKAKSSNFEFTIASYNVLADRLMKDNPYLYYEGKSMNPVIFEWEYRKRNLLKEISHANPDILCLQEVQEEHYHNWFNPQLQLRGYTGAYKRRSGEKLDGCATFFKHDIFSVDYCHTIDYYREHVSLMDRNNVAILLFLSPRNAKKKFSLCVGNTHLLFNERRGDIKLTQLAHLFADIDMDLKLNSVNSHFTPTILCGDFNSQPSSPLYNLITNGEMKYEGLSRYLVSGQCKETGPPDTNFSQILFPRDIGLSNNCLWIDSDDNDAGLLKDADNDSNLCAISLHKGFPSNMDVMKGGSRNIVSNVEKASMLTCNKGLVEKPGYLRHDLAFLSSYSSYSLEGTPYVTTCHDKGASTVDYIFYNSPNTHRGQQLFLSGILRALPEKKLKSMGKLPNQFLSSDHLLLQASFIVHSETE